MGSRNKFWNALTVVLGAAVAASFEDDSTRRAFGAAAGAFVAEMTYFYVWMFQVGEEEDRKRLSWQQPSPRLASLRSTVDRCYKIVVACGGVGGLSLIAGRWSESLFAIGLTTMGLSGVVLLGVWLTIGRERRKLEHLEFGDHPDPNVRALLRGEIDIAEYSKRQTLNP